MIVFVNNKKTDIQCAMLAELVASQNLPEKGVAVAVDNEMIPRSQWETFRLEPSQRITILKAFCGG